MIVFPRNPSNIFDRAIKVARFQFADIYLFRRKGRYYRYSRLDVQRHFGFLLISDVLISAFVGVSNIFRNQVSIFSPANRVHSIDESRQNERSARVILSFRHNSTDTINCVERVCRFRTRQFTFRTAQNVTQYAQFLGLQLTTNNDNNNNNNIIIIIITILRSVARVINEKVSKTTGGAYT